MHMQTGLLALAAMASCAAAAPQAEKKGFSVQQVETGRKVLKSGPLAMMKTYQKFNKPAPAHVVAAAAAVQSGSVVATPQQYDSEYLCPVQIGTGAQTVPLDFDTGSADLWVFSSLMPSTQRSGHAYYTPGSSSTSRVDSGETWDISYGDGSGAKGVVYFDKVVIGGVTATSQAVECATSVSSQFSSNAGDSGLVGLAFDTINTGSPTRLNTFMDNVRSTLPSPIFASYLRKGQAGAYDFGYINSSRYSGSLTYTNINTANGFWEFTASGYTVGTTGYTSSLDSIADTGTTLVYMPTAVCNNYYSKVSGAQNSASAGGYIFPCSSTLPNLSFTIGGASHTIPGSYINYAPYSGSTCFGGLQDSAGIGFNILGDIFLKSQYAVFDLSTPRLGLAQQK